MLRRNTIINNVIELVIKNSYKKPKLKKNTKLYVLTTIYQRPKQWIKYINSQNTNL